MKLYYLYGRCSLKAIMHGCYETTSNCIKCNGMQIISRWTGISVVRYMQLCWKWLRWDRLSTDILPVSFSFLLSFLSPRLSLFLSLSLSLFLYLSYMFLVSGGYNLWTAEFSIQLSPRLLAELGKWSTHHSCFYDDVGEMRNKVTRRKSDFLFIRYCQYI